MFKNYIKIALRNITRNKFLVLINVMGLALSMTCAILIFMTVRYHLSFDDFHKGSDRIYRMVTEQHRAEGVTYNRSVPNPLGKAFRNDYTFAEKVGRIATFDNELITVSKGKHLEKYKDDVAFTEPEFFEIFNYPLLRGNKQTALTQANSVILTETMAHKYFGNEDPIGRTIKLANSRELQVTGILKDLPANTERQTEIYASFETLKEFSYWHYTDDAWGGIDGAMQCFTRLKPGISIPQVEAQLGAYVKKYRPTSQNVHHYKFQPLADIHFGGPYGGAVKKSSLIKLVIIGFFLILTSCVNFINLATAQALKRSREIGVRKVLGGMKIQLFWQFISETAIVCILGAVISCLLSILLLPYINAFFETRISFDLGQVWQLPLFIIILITMVTLMAGSYPGFVLAGFQPILALKGKLSQQTIGGLNIRRALIVTQLSISMFLIIGMLVIIQQLRYTQQADPGFIKEAVVMVPLGNDSTKTAMKVLKNQFANIRDVEHVSLCVAAPASDNTWNNSVKFDNKTEDIRTSLKSADDEYIPLFGLKLLVGRNIFPSDTVKEFVVNEAFVRRANLGSAEEALGKIVVANGGNFVGPVVGVIKDFHDQSFHQSINPVAITTNSDHYYNYAIKINLSNVSSTLASIEKTWSQKHPDQLYEYQFLDEDMARFYETENKILNIVKVFSFIAIFIGCLGLFGLVSFMVINKTKEIGIRKVLGGNVSHIIWLFGKEFIQLALIAFIVAAPIGWWMMNKWLQGFVFRIEIGAWTFILALLVSLAIVVVTIGFQAVKAALMNPVKSLRSE